MNGTRLEGQWARLSIGALVLVGCTTVGTGERTLVKHSCDRNAGSIGSQRTCAFLQDQVPLYVTGDQGSERVLSILARERNRGQTAGRNDRQWTAFERYLRTFYSSATYAPLKLGFVSRDRTRTPPFLQNDLRTLFLNALLRDKPVSAASIDQLRTRIATLSDLVEPTAHHHTEIEPASGAAVRVFYYYPRLSFDFSAALRGLTPPDRLDSLHFIVRLETTAATGSDPIRFLDFSPKDADVTAFARGQLTSAVQAQLTAGLTSTEVDSLVAADAAAGTTRTESITDALAAGPLALAASETMVTQLVDAIERRSAGILDDGRTFFASFRGLRNVKLAGTYNFDVELEVPSTIAATGSFVRSVPVLPPSGELKADVMLVGVIRHVARRGRAGTFTRVPENENDDTFDQVVVKVLPDQVLWTHTATDDDWIDSIVTQPQICKLSVFTNQESATFVVRRAATNEVLASGGGTTTKDLVVTPDPSGTHCSVRVEFLAVVDLTDGVVNELSAPDASARIAVNSSARVFGEYEP